MEKKDEEMMVIMIWKSSVTIILIDACLFLLFGSLAFVRCRRQYRIESLSCIVDVGWNIAKQCHRNIDGSPVPPIAQQHSHVFRYFINTIFLVCLVGCTPCHVCHIELPPCSRYDWFSLLVCIATKRHVA